MLFTRNYRFVEYIIKRSFALREEGESENTECCKTCVRFKVVAALICRVVCLLSYVLARTHTRLDGTIDGATSNREQEAKLVAFINRHFSIY